MPTKSNWSDPERFRHVINDRIILVTVESDCYRLEVSENKVTARQERSITEVAFSVIFLLKLAQKEKRELFQCLRWQSMLVKIWQMLFQRYMLLVGVI